MKQASPAAPKPKEDVEPWLRGTHTGLEPVLRAVLHALELADEDANRWTSNLTEDEFHARPLGLPSVAFYMRHIAGSLDRLCTYAEGQPLSEQQLEYLRSEHDTAIPAESLRSGLAEALRLTADRLLRFGPDHFGEVRKVGRAHLPTTVVGLLIHMAEHTQRHSGQLVTTAKLLLTLRDGPDEPRHLELRVPR